MKAVGKAILLLGAPLAGWLVWQAGDHGGAAARLDPAPAAGVVLVALLGNTVLCGWRWAVVADLPVLQAMRWYLEASFFAILVPGGVGGDVHRIRRGSSKGAARSTTAVAADRVLGGVTTLVVAAPCALAVLPTRGAIAVVLGALVAVPALVVVRRRLLARFAPVREITVRQVTKAGLLTLGYLGVFAVVLELCALAVGAHPALLQPLLWAPLVAVSGMLPSLHGVGPAQGAMALFVAALGAPAGAAAAAAALSLLTLLAAGVAGVATLGFSARRPREVVA